MEVVYERCCGLDVHKKIIVACIITSEKKEIRTFGTLTEELMKLVDWIKDEQCQCVAMESTGVYWKPIYNLLELSEVKSLVVNAQHMKAVPGRKTDVKDSEWIADLLKHGLLTGSYIPCREQRETKEKVRYRRSLVEERARELNRIQKVFEGANIKLSSVVSNINGASAKQIIRLLLEKTPEVEELKLLMHGNMKSSAEDIKKALTGLINDHQKSMISMMLRHIEYLDMEIARLDEEIREKMKPVLKQIEQIDGILGVGERSAQTIIAEIGTDMSVFPTDAHLCSWAGMCPGNNESAGKKKDFCNQR